jgi:hypothetical protein
MKITISSSLFYGLCWNTFDAAFRACCSYKTIEEDSKLVIGGTILDVEKLFVNTIFDVAVANIDMPRPLA